MRNDQHDDDDIAKEIRNLFISTNSVKRMYHKCSLAVKLTLFKCFVCVSMTLDYGVITLQEP